MTKAFDWADLLERLKSKGLVAVEKDVKIITAELIGWTKDSVNMLENPLYKLVIPAIDFVEPLILKLEDKIDGVEGN